MIQSIKLIEESEEQEFGYTMPHDHKMDFDCSSFGTKPISIKIEFLDEIVNFRNFDHNWVEIKGNHLSNWYSPKIIELKNGYFVQSSHLTGIWEVDCKNKRTLYWHFNKRNSKPISNYDENNSRKIIDADSVKFQHEYVSLLFSKEQAMEVSRSRVPFSAIVCFTDHCDFDNLKNLEEQRLFFKRKNIRITKGFFLNDFSNKSDTACYAKHNEELSKWLADGHELAYHSLSKSIKSLDESISDFKLFNPPFDIKTYIDHGFQPYNFSLFENHEALKFDYGNVLRDKGVEHVWNYIDSGTSVKGVINQINPAHFTLERFSEGIKHLSFRLKVQMLIKNIIFHYFNDDDNLKLYRSIAIHIKSTKKKKIKRHLLILKKMVRLSWRILPILLLWPRKKRKIYPLAKFSPLMFNHHISGNEFFVFQTLEMVDFKLGLCKDNIDLLIEESGLFIAHTYFSAPMNYHRGKLFGKIGEVDPVVESNFEYLSSKIEAKEIWNPTLKELVQHLSSLKSVVFDCNEHGAIKVECQKDIVFRNII